MTFMPLRPRDGRVRFALLDADDFETVKDTAWRLHVKQNGAMYACESTGGRYLHRVLLGLKRGQICDHRNGDGLDNRRSNLRVVTNAQNLQNRRGPNQNNRSGYRGVAWDNETGRWLATATMDGKTTRLGRFDRPEDAAEVIARFRAEHMPFSEMDKAVA